MVVDVSFVLDWWNICPPAGHKFYVSNVAFFAFELEVTIDGEEKGI
jgi:hypothetical protein